MRQSEERERERETGGPLGAAGPVFRDIWAYCSRAYGGKGPAGHAIALGFRSVSGAFPDNARQPTLGGIISLTPVKQCTTLRIFLQFCAVVVCVVIMCGAACNQKRRPGDCVLTCQGT